MNVNRTTIALAVNAAFNLTIDGETVASTIKNRSTTYSYQYGLFAEQDIRVLMSIIYALRVELVKLMDGSDRPLQDIPREGSLDANDNGVSNEAEVERQEAIKQVAYEMAVLERHLISLDEQARKDLEEAGHKSQDGGRVRYNRQNRQYRSYVNTWEDWLVDAKATTAVDSAWYRKLVRAEESVYIPVVSAQEATDRYMEFVSDDRLERSARRAWELIQDSLVECGLELDRHERVMQQLNDELMQVGEAYRGEERKLKVDAVKSKIALETREHKDNINRPQWMLSKRLEPTALLAHVGAPSMLIDSPEWRTKEAEGIAAKARADAAYAQAQLAEMQANMAVMEANAQLIIVRKNMAVMQEAMNKQMKELNALMAVPKVEKAEKPKAEKPKAKEKEKSVIKGVNIMSSRGSILQPSFRRG